MALRAIWHNAKGNNQTASGEVAAYIDGAVRCKGFFGPKTALRMAIYRA